MTTTSESRTSQARYSDDELLRLLETVIFDYGKYPSQRIVLGDYRLPTHHTYNARFGGIKDAVDLLGLEEIGDNEAQHVVLGSIIKRFGGEILQEKPWIGSAKSKNRIKANYLYLFNGQEYYVDLMGVDGTLSILDRNLGRRQQMADWYLADKQNAHYFTVLDAIDIIPHLEI